MRRSSASNSRSNTAWTLPSSSSSSSPSASKTPTARTGSALQRSASVRQQSRKPPSSAIWSDISFALTPQNRSTSRGTSDTRGYPASTGTLGKRTRSTVERRESHLLIPSSDSGDEVECVPTLTRSASVSQKPRYTKLASIPIVLDDLDDDDDDFVQVSTTSRRSSSQAGSIRRATRIAVCVDDSDDGVEVVPVKRQAVSRAASPPRTPAQTLGDMFLPSSPQLLRPNSPTIRRHNSQSSQPVMLVDSTQTTQSTSHTVARSRYPIPSSPAENSSSSIGGSTLIGSSYGRHELGRAFSNRSSSMASFKAADIQPLVAVSEEDGADVNAIPETPRMSQRELMMPSSPPDIPSLPLPAQPPSSPPAANIGQTNQRQHSSIKDYTISRLPADVQKYLRADLASDPISEFGTPTASPTASNRIAAPRFAGRNTRQAPSIESDNSVAREPGVQRSDELPGITQWYHDGLSKYGDEDGQEFSQSENSLGLNAASHGHDGMGMSESQQGYSYESESILIEDDDDVDGDESTGGHNNSRGEGTEDGYSSPLEGFWDLRDASVGTTQDREMYVNQFAPSKLQVARRQRKKDKMDAVQASLNSSSEAEAGEMAQFQPASLLAARSSGRGRRGRGAGRAARPAKRARGGAARPSRGGKRTQSRRSAAIRPMVSSRSGPSSSRPPAASASASTASAHYNHYMNEPVLDMAASMNWEGGGMSRFG